MNTSPARLPACSIVIPCYNAAGTLAETLDTVFAQTCQDFEILAIDDGSKDTTAAVLGEIARREPRLVVIRQDNAGCSAARNRGILAARHPLVAFLDADDKWPAEHLAIHARRMTADPELGLSFSGTRFVDANGTPTGETCNPKLSGITAADVLRVIPCLTSAIVVRRELFDEVGLFNTELKRAEDQEWVFRVALSRWTIAGVTTPLVDYRTGASSLSADLEALLDGYLGMIASARRLAPQLVEEHGQAAVAGMMRHLARSALRSADGRATAANFMRRALATHPRMLLSEPRTTIATLLACHVPLVDTLLRNRRRAA